MHVSTLMQAQGAFPNPLGFTAQDKQTFHFTSTADNKLLLQKTLMAFGNHILPVVAACFCNISAQNRQLLPVKNSY